MSAKRPKGRWVVYEQRKGKFILLSRLFTTRPQAEKERDRLEAAFTYKKVSFGVGVVAKELQPSLSIRNFSASSSCLVIPCRAIAVARYKDGNVRSFLWRARGDI